MSDLTLKPYDPLYPMRIHPYEELLKDQNASVIDKINSIIDYLNSVGKLTSDVVKNWNTVYNWVMNDGLTTGINNKLEDMLAKGEFDTILNTVVTKIGDITTLTTTDKTNLTKAINEIVLKIGNLANLTTTDKTSVVNSVNEINAGLASNTNFIQSNVINIKMPFHGLTAVKGDGVTDDTLAIQAIIDYVKSIGGGTIFFPIGVYKISSELRINSHYIHLVGCGVNSKILNTNTTGGASINISPPDTTPIPFFVSIEKLWIQGNTTSTGHGIYTSYGYNVLLRDLYLNGHGRDGIYTLHVMNSIMENVRSDENNNGFSLNQVDSSKRSTTWTIINSYFGNNRNLGGLMSGGDSNVLIKPLFESNANGGLYITNGETNPNIHAPYFEFNSGYSLNIDNGSSGYIYGGRFADENVNAHINLGDTTGWIIIGTWHSTNSVGGTGVNIRKTFAGGNDLVIASSLNGATPLSENAGAIKLIDNTGFIDRFKISTNDDIKINNAGKGVIFTTPDGLSTKKVAVDNSSRLTIDNTSIGRYVTTTPVSAIASGVEGDWSSDSSYLYICHAPNTWKRVAIATW